MAHPAPSTSDNEHSVFNHAFTPEVRKAMEDEDTESWYGVCGELIFIVSGGLLLGLVGVLCSIALM